ncbi:MAG TPA: hypothetical protein VHK28_01135, partial [Candidatus Limnocylindria bacterium]|nr:hypothetical protein [Candidatus Limnocylindria bacterium]
MLSALALVLSTAGTAIAAPPEGRSANGPAPKSDNLPNPLGNRQATLKQQAQEMILKGQAKAQGKNKVVKLAPGQFVELA